MEEHKQALLDARGKILEKFNSEKEQKIKWLVQFIDIEDELEELSLQQSQWAIEGKLT
ncbi:MAG: hypothetical protein P4L69_17295 [Desulfosporosinus sp.]|nr:hypothetical protein [Desulfosporosinus sp.]